MTKKEQKPQEYFDLPEILQKRVIVYNGHHYLRVKWVESYIRFVRNQMNKKDKK